MADNNNNFKYSQKPTTAICYESPSEANPYSAKSIYLQGYDLIELTQKKSFVEVLLLTMLGELPDADSVELMNALMVGLINPGPRNPAVRAAMTAGVSKTNTPHILPIGLMVLGGEFNGSMEVEKTMHFIKENINSPANEIIKHLDQKIFDDEGDVHPFPGIGSKYGSIDLVTTDLAKYIATLKATGSSFKWLQALINTIDNSKIGWLPTGLAASVFLDLGVAPREGGALFQLLCAPGILAHGLEQTHKPVTAMPFLEDVFCHGYSMMNELLGKISYMQMIVLNVTGRLISDNLSKWLEGNFIGMSYPDSRIWCNQIGALAGTTRTSPVAAATAGTLASDSRAYGGSQTNKIAMLFIQDCLKKYQVGESVENLINTCKFKNGKPVIVGYARPVDRTDERIKPHEKMTQELGFEIGKNLSLAYKINDYLEKKYALGINIGAYSGAFYLDQSFSPEEIYQIKSLVVSSGVLASYIDNQTKPAESFLPQKCNDIEYNGPTFRTLN